MRLHDANLSVPDGSEKNEVWLAMRLELNANLLRSRGVKWSHQVSEREQGSGIGSNLALSHHPNCRYESTGWEWKNCWTDDSQPRHLVRWSERFEAQSGSPVVRASFASTDQPFEGETWKESQTLRYLKAPDSEFLSSVTFKDTGMEIVELQAFYPVSGISIRSPSLRRARVMTVLITGWLV